MQVLHSQHIGRRTMESCCNPFAVSQQQARFLLHTCHTISVVCRARV
jgi:hypothetical protein